MESNETGRTRIREGVKVRVGHVSNPTCQSTDRFEVRVNKEKVLLPLFCPTCSYVVW